MSLVKDNTIALELVRYFGDGPITIPLTHPETGAAYTPTGTLIFTLKTSAADADADSLVQKISSVGGLTLANPAVVTLVPADYTALARDGTYEFDVQEQIGSNPPLTVARGTITFAYDVTRELTISISTTTTNPAAGYGWGVLTGIPASISALGALTPAADRLAYFDGSSSGALTAFTATARALLADATAADMRTTLGLGNVDNTSDANKPVSTAQAAADSAVASAASSALAAHAALTSNPHSVTATQVGLGNVENTALSTWAGSTSLTTLGTIATGTWNATTIADGKIASALTGKTYNGLTISTTTGTLTLTNAKTLAATNSLTFSGTDGTVMTFPTTSATIARTDAANTFTGTQTISTITAPASTSLVLGGGGSGTTLTLPSDATGGAPAAFNHAVTGTRSFGGGLGFTFTNTSSAGNAVFTAVNDTGVSVTLSAFGSAVGPAALQNMGTLSGSGSLRVFTNGSSSSGQSGTVVFAPGGYADADVLTISRTAVTSAKALTVSATTASTSSTTGALINAGGFGNAGASWFGSTVNITVADTALSFSGAAASRQGMTMANTGASASFGIASSGTSNFFLGDTAYGLAIGTNNATVFEVGTNNNIRARWSTTGGLYQLTTTASTSTTTGSLINAGGFGNAGKIFSGSDLVFSNTNSSVGRIQFIDTAGTHYNWQVSQSNVAYNTFEITPSTAAGGSTFSTPALKILADTVGTITLAYATTISSTTASTSTTTGSLINAGGFGNAGAAYIGGNLTVASSTITLSGVSGNNQFIALGNNANSALYVLANAASTKHWAIYTTPGVSGGQTAFKIYDYVAGAAALSIEPSTWGVTLAGRLNIPTATPASAGAAGTAGDIAWDASYIYVCTAASTWKRAAIATW